ncbi:MAG: HNH endonuclease [Candidatus Nanopelagicales bacterium]
MARNTALIRLAAQAAWVDELISINRLRPEEHALREFLFGADRRALGRVADGLADLQAGRCFYCGGGLRASFEVDHVVPWSLNPNDDLFNLVAADRQCNSGKRDRLLVGESIAGWASRSRVPLADLGRDRGQVVPLSGEEGLLCVAFANRKGVALLDEELSGLADRGGCRMLLTSAFGGGRDGITAPAVRRLHRAGVRVRVLNPGGGTYHPKMYLSRRRHAVTGLVGSANLTSGLLGNIETGVGCGKGHRSVARQPPADQPQRAPGGTRTPNQPGPFRRFRSGRRRPL